ncbi:tRNA (adenosine(37)-N6)-dimethylallyltransferase MiaA [Blastopirellula marina]|uniref:tRNA dimethylallyltransferase n=1 Tax=Blastopirellula marina TaxID=124 RepID=A0A2S8F043_9BACT|nr:MULTISPECIES: tRNA (adenosine(37)-N6)-dimethylallyltransferase MiaA [Pirellulaceae]PQO25523.1 tRNA (adenosine(37)-N6)-dimethylallyltransferase MiaA [Blastopirellula marina]RCS42487.1 tRNA (adenosine(37)-N6)-dimethylallyltransferase MiaA [Bremerella cremea]
MTNPTTDKDFTFRDCWFLSGATASGKTRVGLRLAEKINAEIIALDSMSLYRLMDIGTAKPTPEEQSAATHHLIDVLDPNENSSISHYLELAEAAAKEIRSRGKEVLFVGGTPLYLKALLRGLSEGPAPDPELRKDLEEEAARVGNAALHARLKMVDPLAAARIHENDTRRMIRALEVHQATGQPMSHYQFEFEDHAKPEDCKAFWLSWERSVLHDRINQRVEAMFQAGLIEEVQRLLDQFSPLSTTAMQAVGYQEVIDYLAGNQELESAKDRVKARTRQFAKRQCTWFRSLPECREVTLTEPFDAEAVAQQIYEMGTAS